jgi:hypothetical protein
MPARSPAIGHGTRQRASRKLSPAPEGRRVSGRSQAQERRRRPAALQRRIKRFGRQERGEATDTSGLKQGPYCEPWRRRDIHPTEGRNGWHDSTELRRLSPVRRKASAPLMPKRWRRGARGFCVAAGPGDAIAGKPSANPLLQSCRVELARQCLLGKPGPERSLRRSFKRDHGEEIQNLLSMPPSRPARPFMAIRQDCRHADLISQMGNHRRCEVGFRFEESRILLVKGELDGEAQLAGVGLATAPAPRMRAISARPAPRVTTTVASSPPHLSEEGLSIAGRRSDGQNAQLRGRWANQASRVLYI